MGQMSSPKAWKSGCVGRSPIASIPAVPQHLYCKQQVAGGYRMDEGTLMKRGSPSWTEPRSRSTNSHGSSTTMIAVCPRTAA